MTTLQTFRKTAANKADRKMVEALSLALIRQGVHGGVQFLNAPCAGLTDSDRALLNG